MMTTEQLVWTDDLPTREGWYWVKDGTTLRVICVASEGNELTYHVDGMNADDLPNCQWAGPIPAPVEREGKR